MVYPPLLEQLLYWTAWIVLVLTVGVSLEFLRGNRSMKFLKALPPLARPEDASVVSIIIAARDEAENIREALTSVLELDYPAYEVCVVNDRSTDATGEILEAMRTEYPQLKVTHIDALPPGWLGKNHALYVGAKAAQGSLYLFMDADVHLEPTVLSRAVRYMRERQLNHLTVAPHILTHDRVLEMFLGAFTLFFGLYARPWRAVDPKSAAHIGVGAFNLMQANTYETIGTHKAIAMRPDDDMKLGKLVKHYGFRQEAVFSQDMVSVEWYASLKDLIAGLMKNAFAGQDYNLPKVIAGVVFTFLFNIWPFLALLMTQGVTQMIYAWVAVLLLALYADNARFHKLNPWYAPYFPIAAGIMIYIILRAAIKTLSEDGIDWRGTHYPLRELRANKV